MNIKEYKNKKAKGLAEIVKAGGGYAYAVKRFSPDDGTGLDPEITSINLKEIAKRKSKLQDEISDCDLVVADIGALKTKT